MRFFSVLFLSTATLLCLGFSVTDPSSRKPLIPIQSEKDSLLALIQGDWRCVDIRYEGPKYETCCNEPYLGIHILNDTVFHLDYPHKFYYATTPDDIVLSHDTLIISNKYCYNRLAAGKFDSAILKMLKTDTVNPASLIGTWELDTWKEMEYEGEENYDGTIHFPFKLKQVLTFTQKTAKLPLLKGTKLIIPVNGVNKPCFIVSINKHRITLRTGSWYESGFEFAYNRKS